MNDTPCFDWETEMERLTAENEELRSCCDMLRDENSKLGLQFEKLLKEKSDLDRELGFLEGQIEAYRYCLKGRR